MGVNKVVYGTKVVIDISDSTVTADKLASGVIAYNAKGERIVGTGNLATGTNGTTSSTRNVNKVIYGTTVIIDISDSTVTPATLLKNVVAYNAKGQRIVGTATTVVNYTITRNLINVSSSNTTASITSGSSYTVTLTANSGYNLYPANVTVTLGGKDITSTAYSNGVVTISKVTANIVITAKAVDYTNIIPTSTTTSTPTSAVFNGCGYGEYEYEGETFYATGYITGCSNGDDFYFGNISPDIILAYRGSTLVEAVDPYGSNNAGLIFYEDDDGISQMNVGRYGKAPNFYNITSFRVLSYSEIDENSIITENEPIE